jgi:hypothetical protein
LPAVDGGKEGSILRTDHHVLLFARSEDAKKWPKIFTRKRTTFDTTAVSVVLIGSRVTFMVLSAETLNLTDQISPMQSVPGAFLPSIIDIYCDDHQASMQRKRNDILPQDWTTAPDYPVSCFFSI